MKTKFAASLLAIVSVLLVSLGIHGKAAAARPNGSMPVQVGFNYQGMPIGGGADYTMTVTMSDEESDDEDVSVSYSNLTGPVTVTIPAGSYSGTANIALAGESGDLASATASNDNGQAEGSFTIP